MTDGNSPNHNTAPGSSEAPQSAERTLIEGALHYLAILLRYWLFIFIVTAAAAGGVVAYSIYTLRLPPEESPLPNRYEAYATLLVGEDSGDGAQSVLESLGMGAPQTAGTTTGRLAMEVLQSRSFIDSIIEQNNMLDHYNMHNANRTRRRQVVLANARFNLDGRTGRLSISYQDILPEYAAEVANSIVDELDRYFRERGGARRGTTLESLERTLAEVDREIAGIEAEIRRFQREYGVLSVEELASSQSAMVRSLETELVQLERSIRTYTERTRIEDDPELMRMRAERDTVADLIEQIEAGYAGGDRSMPARSELPELSLRLGRLQTDLALQQRIRNSLHQEYQVARLAAESGPGFTVLERAEVPDEKIGPSRADLSMRVTLGAFGASIALAFAHYGLTVLRRDPKLMGIVKAGVSKDKKKTARTEKSA